MINEDEFKYSHFEFKKNCNIGKLHLPPKIHKSLLNIPEIEVMLNCGVHTAKVSESFYVDPGEKTLVFY